mgnify:FL=1
MAKRLTIHRDNNPIYDIVIKNSFEDMKDEFVRLNLQGRKICIVSDSVVAPLYLDTVKNSLAEVSDCITEYVFEAGEKSKNLNIVKSLYEFLILNKFERRDILVALGGGVVGDLTGFTAATYLRGIDFIQVPTTLLAQVDSSIGGKTGVDFDSYKNMVGAFYMPRLVYINISTLNTLDERIFNSGFGEIIKHAYIKDSEYLDYIKNNTVNIMSRQPGCLEEIIYKSCVIKGNVVEKDPTEKGDRMLLNFGHTLGHAIEKLSGFALYHGECVVLGMICALYISKKRGSITDAEYESAIRLFKDFNYPMTVSGIKVNEVVDVSKNDKKMSAGKIRFVLLNAVGDAYIDYDVSEGEMLESLQEVIR